MTTRRRYSQSFRLASGGLILLLGAGAVRSASAADTGHDSGMAMASSGRLGEYPMMRDASGTSWQPDSALMDGVHGHLGDWSTMLHGYLYAIADHQGGPRGAQLNFSESMLMLMAQRNAGAVRVALKAMLSLDPLMGKRD